MVNELEMLCGHAACGKPRRLHGGYTKTGACPGWGGNQAPRFKRLGHHPIQRWEQARTFCTWITWRG